MRSDPDDYLKLEDDAEINKLIKILKEDSLGSTEHFWRTLLNLVPKSTYQLIYQSSTLLQSVSHQNFSYQLLTDFHKFFREEDDQNLVKELAQVYRLNERDLLNYLTILKSTYEDLLNTVLDLNLVYSEEIAALAINRLISTVNLSEGFTKKVFNISLFINRLSKVFPQLQSYCSENPLNIELIDNLVLALEDANKNLEKLPSYSLSIQIAGVSSNQKSVWNLIHILAFSYVVYSLFSEYINSIYSLLKNAGIKFNSAEAEKLYFHLLSYHPLKHSIFSLLKIIFAERYNLNIFSELDSGDSLNQLIHAESKVSNMLAKDTSNSNEFGQLTKLIATHNRRSTNTPIRRENIPAQQLPEGYKGNRNERMSTYRQDMKDELLSIENITRNQSKPEALADPTNRLERLNEKVIILIQNKSAITLTLDKNYDNLIDRIQQTLDCNNKLAEQIAASLGKYFRIPDIKTKIRSRKVYNTASNVTQIEFYIGDQRLYVYTVNEPIYSNYIFITINSHGHSTSENWKLDKDSLLKFLPRES